MSELDPEQFGTADRAATQLAARPSARFLDWSRSDVTDDSAVIKPRLVTKNDWRPSPSVCADHDDVRATGAEVATFTGAPRLGAVHLAKVVSLAALGTRLQSPRSNG